MVNPNKRKEQPSKKAVILNLPNAVLKSCIIIYNFRYSAKIIVNFQSLTFKAFVTSYLFFAIEAKLSIKTSGLGCNTQN